MSDDKVILLYVGKGSLYNVPARDLTERDFKERAEEWKEAGWDETSLVGTGLYEFPMLKAKPKTEGKKKEGE